MTDPLRQLVEDLRYDMLSRIHDDGDIAVGCQYVADKLSAALLALAGPTREVKPEPYQQEPEGGWPPVKAMPPVAQTGRVAVSDDLDHCGYFDNGYDSNHEHRMNCRRCLMDRVLQLTETVSQQAHDLTRHVQRERGAIAEVRRYLSPENANTELLPLIRDLAQIKITSMENVEELSKRLDLAERRLRLSEDCRDSLAAALGKVPMDEVCLGCGKPTATSDCGCPAGTGMRPRRQYR